MLATEDCGFRPSNNGQQFRGEARSNNLLKQTYFEKLYKDEYIDNVLPREITLIWENLPSPGIILKEGTSFVNFSLLSWIGNPFLNWVYSLRKEFALWEQILSFKELTLVEKGVASLERVSICVKLR